MNWFGQSSITLPRSGQTPSLVIGLVNNTSDRARVATERQFTTLFQAAAPQCALRFELFTCPGITRANGHHADIGALFETPVDALIVTGMEPQARALEDEPVWDGLCRLVDWAERHAIPTVWSCLAAHAAILYLDGIARRRLPGKLSGIFACETACADPLLRGVASRWGSPHSRYNEVPEAALRAAGYDILSRSDETGADIFVRGRRAPFVFFQGHPEYEPDSLLHEYKRDVRRYLAGERDDYPAMPQSYFDGATTERLAAIQDEVVGGARNPAKLSEICALVNDLSYAQPWRSPATAFVANWLDSVVGGARPCVPSHAIAELGL